MPAPRIDFIKFNFTGTYEATMRKQAKVGDAYDVYNRASTWHKQSHLRHADYHDGVRKCHVAWIEVDGPVAHDLASLFGAAYHDEITRLDYRYEVVAPEYTYAEMRRAFHQHANSKITFMEMGSRERTKTSKRDSGGESLYSGAAGSDRRLVYYNRGNENYALEARFLNKIAQRVMDTTCNAYASCTDKDFIDCLTEVLEDYTKDLFTERTGMYWNVFIGLEDRSEQIGSFLIQEELLAMIDGTLDVLDADAKKAFLIGLAQRADIATLLVDIIEDEGGDTYEDDIRGLDA